MIAVRARAEFGDFQTPPDLASACCRILVELGISPRTILEPTCGSGAFLKAGVDIFQEAELAKGFEINPEYAVRAQTLLLGVNKSASVSVTCADFFDTNWTSVIACLPQPLLVLGNPPWVTNSALSIIGSDNLPEKSNFQGRPGIEAVTGKGNFDISEYMLLHLAEALQGKTASIAMLCKTAVARKVMAYCWKRNMELSDCHVFPIDAQRAFGAAVEACLFVASFNREGPHQVGAVHNAFDAASCYRQIGYLEGILVSDLDRYSKWNFLRSQSGYTWRSGVKHDCAKVMEFAERDGALVNGFGQLVDIEDTYLYPLLKGSTVAGSEKTGARWVLVTQRTPGADTSTIQEVAPKTWRYLLDHSDLLDKRASIIYKKRPRFCVFGIGEYSFSPWKVAISGLYKKLDFRVFGPRLGRPVMLDDTSYFLACEEESEARFLADLLNSEPAEGLLSSLIFWDAKRPITVECLSQLSLERLAEYLGEPGALRHREQRALAF